MEDVMAKFEVIIPASCHVTAVVEAESEAEAINALFESCFNVTATDGVAIENLELHRLVGHGNVCEFSSPWEAIAERVNEG
jgi:D-hexose-6-phosphate mutarotase